eukprot:6289088-Lingulodinium_polyedra.AAC.1
MPPILAAPALGGRRLPTPPGTWPDLRLSGPRALGESPAGPCVPGTVGLGGGRAVSAQMLRGALAAGGGGLPRLPGKAA